MDNRNGIFRSRLSPTVAEEPIARSKMRHDEDIGIDDVALQPIAKGQPRELRKLGTETRDKSRRCLGSDARMIIDKLPLTILAQNSAKLGDIGAIFAELV